MAQNSYYIIFVQGGLTPGHLDNVRSEVCGNDFVISPTRTPGLSTKIYVGVSRSGVLESVATNSEEVGNGIVIPPNRRRKIIQNFHYTLAHQRYLNLW